MVSILIPTYNRREFSDLISYNINIQDSIHIKEVVVFDDGDVEQCLNLNVKYPVKYHMLPRRMSIGEKRNKMIKMCNSKYAIFMDTDDIYLPTYVSYSLSLMSKKKPIVGSADMLFYFKNAGNFSKMSCLKTHLIHEATMCVNVKWFSKLSLFNNNNTGEGQGLKGYDKFIEESDISKCMICIAHDTNTVSKDSWNKPEYHEQLSKWLTPKIENHLKILNSLNI